MIRSARYNIIYSIVIIIFVSIWPYVVYSNTGTMMNDETQREKFIRSIAFDYSKKMKINGNIHFRINNVAGSAGSFSGESIIFISKEMLNTKIYSDNDVRFIIGHELGHIKRYDAYRFWTKWNRSLAEDRELKADKIATNIIGCEPMIEIINNHLKEFMIGYYDDIDPHPNPFIRLKESCGI